MTQSLECVLKSVQCCHCWQMGLLRPLLGTVTLLVVVDQSYGQHASGLSSGWMLELLVMSAVGWGCVERGGLWADAGSWTSWDCWRPGGIILFNGTCFNLEQCLHAGGTMPTFLLRCAVPWAPETQLCGKVFPCVGLLYKREFSWGCCPAWL